MNVNAGRVAMVYKEEWDEEAKFDYYEVLDVVSYKGNTYCLYRKVESPSKLKNPLEDSVSEEPHWFKMALGTTIQIDDDVEVLNPNQDPAIENIGTELDLKYKFKLPRASQFTVGDITTVTPGGEADVEINETTAGDYTIDFAIPRGAQVKEAEVSTVNPSVSPSVTITDCSLTDKDKKLTFKLPRGASVTNVEAVSSSTASVTSTTLSTGDIKLRFGLPTGASGKDGVAQVAGASGINVSYSTSSGVGTFTAKHSNSVTSTSDLVVRPAAYDAQGHIKSYGAEYKPTTTLIVTLPYNSWSSNKQTVYASDFYANGYVYFVSPQGNPESYSKAKIYADTVTTDGQMVFHCGDKVPTTDINVIVTYCKTKNNTGKLYLYNNGVFSKEYTQLGAAVTEYDDHFMLTRDSSWTDFFYILINDSSFSNYNTIGISYTSNVKVQLDINGTEKVYQAASVKTEVSFTDTKSTYTRTYIQANDDSTSDAYINVYEWWLSNE